MKSPPRALRFLLCTWEGGGSVPPVVAVARKLVGAGHQVRIMSDACNRADALGAGAEFAPWTRAPSRADKRRENDPVKDWLAPDPVAGLQRALEGVVTGPALAYAQDVIEELARAPADLVVSSDMLLGVLAGCEAVGQPHVCLAANISLYPVPGVPPMGPGLAPAQTEADRDLHQQIAAQTEQLFDLGLPALNAARAELGLGPLAHTADQARSASAMILAVARAFDFAPATLPPHLHYIGPQLEVPGWAAKGGEPGEATGETPLVAVCFSTTFQNQVAALQNVVAALSELPVRGVVTLGPAVDGDEVEPAPNVQVLPSADHDRLMRDAAVVITHGGHGTVSRALSHRRPMLLMPQGRDQADNAVRVALRGAGLVLPPDSPSVAIAEAVRRLLDDPAFARAAERLGGLCAAESEAASVVELLAGYARAARRERSCEDDARAATA